MVVESFVHRENLGKPRSKWRRRSCEVNNTMLFGYLSSMDMYRLWSPIQGEMVSTSRDESGLEYKQFEQRISK